MRLLHPDPSPSVRLRRLAHSLTGAAASEAALTSAFRVLSGGAILTGLVLTFSSSHLIIGLVGALPLLSRSAQPFVPRIVRRYGVWRVTSIAAWVERLGFLGAATAGVFRPDHALAYLLAGVGIGTLAAAVYDIALTAMTRERVRAEDQGVFFGIRTRWSSVFGVAVGIVAGLVLDAVEARGMLPGTARGVALIAGLVPAIIAIVALRRFDAQPRLTSLQLPLGFMRDEAARKTPIATATIGGAVERTEGLPVPPPVLPCTTGEIRRFSGSLRGLLWFGAVWGFSTGLLVRHVDAFAMGVLDYSVGTLTIIAGLVAGAGAVGAKTWGRLGDRYGAKAILVLAAFLIAINPLWYAAATSSYAWPYLVAQVMGGLASSGWAIGVPLLLLNTPLGRRGDPMRAFALFQATVGIAAGVGPLAGGWLLTQFSAANESTAYLSLFLVSAVLRLGSVWILVRVPATAPGGTRYLVRVMWRRMRMRVRVAPRIAATRGRAA